MLWSDYYGAIPFDRELDVIGAARFVEEVYDNADAFGRRIKLLLVENLLAKEQRRMAKLMLTCMHVSVLFNGDAAFAEIDFIHTDTCVVAGVPVSPGGCVSWNEWICHLMRLVISVTDDNRQTFRPCVKSPFYHLDDEFEALLKSEREWGSVI